jgi:hypothetical protein
MLCINERREKAGSGLLIYETLFKERSLESVFFVAMLKLTIVFNWFLAVDWSARRRLLREKWRM